MIYLALTLDPILSVFYMYYLNDSSPLNKATQKITVLVLDKDIEA